MLGNITMAGAAPPAAAGDEMDRGGDLTLGVRRVAALSQFPDGAYRVGIETTRGVLPGVFHPVEGGTAAVIWISGALGGFNGPAGGLYPVIARDLRASGVTSLRITYRWPNELEECVLDTLAAASVLKGLGANDLAVVGHSFGGAVAILAGTLQPLVRGVVALSSQVHGTRTVEQLSPRRLYLLHGTADTRLPARASEDIYERAREPKEIALIPGAGHSLAEAEAEVRSRVRGWLLATFDLPPAEVPPPPDGAADFHPRNGGAGARLRLTAADLFHSPAEVIVCPANDQLWPDGPIGERLVALAGAGLAGELMRQRRPQAVGSVVALDLNAADVPARVILQAVIARSDNPFQATSEEVIQQVTGAALAAAEERGLGSVAFPALGTGGAGLAVEQSARAMLAAVAARWAAGAGPAEVIVATPSTGVQAIYAEAARVIFKAG